MPRIPEKNPYFPHSFVRIYTHDLSLCLLARFSQTFYRNISGHSGPARPGWLAANEIISAFLFLKLLRKL